MRTKKILLFSLFLVFVFSNVYAGKISGVVNDAQDQPVSNAIVYILGVITSTSDTLSYSTTSDDNGRFSFNDLENGTYYTDAQTIVETQPKMNVWTTMAGPFEVNQNSDFKDVVLKFNYILTEFGDLSGYVKTDAGSPLADLTVQAYSDETINTNIKKTVRYCTKTNADGYYSFQNIMSGKYHVSSSHPIAGVKQNDELIQVVTDKEAIAADIVYTTDEIATGYITGSVMFGNGNTPVIGASVEFITIDVDTAFAFYKNAKVLTDINGDYELSMSPGEYIVMCQYADSQVPFFVQYYDNTQDINAAKLIKVDAGQTVLDIDFTVPEPKVLPEVTISGKVTDEQGTAISKATVELIFQSAFYSCCPDSLNRSETVTTDANGNYSFTLKDVKSPSTEIVLSAVSFDYFREFYNDQPEYYLADALVPGEQTVFENINFTLTAKPDASPYTISGIVKSDAGIAIEGVEVTAYHTDAVNIVSARTNSEGKYELTNLYTGNYVVQFYAPDYVPEFYNDVENWEKATMLNPDQPLMNINASLTSFGADSSSCKVMGRVMSKDGAELGGVLVSVKNSDGKTVGFDFTNNHGQYWIDGLANGDLTIMANRVQYDNASDVIRFSETVSTMVHNVSLKKANGITSVETGTSGNKMANSFVLKGNYPNPFNPVTTIRFELNNPAQVSVTIYNNIGQEVIQLNSNSLVAGTQAITWNGVNRHGAKVQSGVYFYRIVATFNNGIQEAQTGRMLLLK